MSRPVPLRPRRIPLASYRLQFSAQLTFEGARGLVEYLDGLGISDAYPSPLFRAREGSSHGYDVVDHAAIEPQFGTENDFQAFAEALRARGMGLMMDVVPNHMGIDDEHNQWWQDVLENGTSARHARFFDIDWYPPKEALHEKVLLPFLGDQFGRVLENGEVKLVYEDHAFRISCYGHRYPLAPRTWLMVLRPVLERLSASRPAEDPQRMELESILTALENLPSRSERDRDRIQERYREKEVVRRRLATLYESPAIAEAVQRVIEEINGRPGDPRSLDALERLLDAQAYRLCYWRVASDEINYRRFFDINALAAIRVEDPEVFEAVHAMIFRYLGEGWVTELRIDHPDGLLDPLRYFQNLQEGYRRAIERTAPGAAEGDGQSALVSAGATLSAVAAAADGAPVVSVLVGAGGTVPVALPEASAETRPGPSLYLAVEKILGHDEALPPEWPVAGTTGYDFLNLVNGLFVDHRGAQAIQGVYGRFIDRAVRYADVLYEGKRTILSISMSSELYVLAGQLDRISEQHRWSRDFTRSSLHRALREVIACFPVYRTYIRPDASEVCDEDRRRILTAVRAAKRRNPELSPSFFDFIASVLLLDHPDGLTEAQRLERLQFVLKLQQVTGPVMAKGLEDTAFYRYYPLASLNEVGGEPNLVGTSPADFHRRNAERLEQWPYAMLATATHDTKRGEDTRARLNVLSEIPGEWEQAIHRWHDWNHRYLTDLDGSPAPDANEEYLLYQTLVGTWPLETLRGPSRAAYVERIANYMAKALKEAKLHTSWANPYEEYDSAVARFVQAILDPQQSAEFLADLDALVRSIAEAGWVNSLAQTLLKICCPGVPDFYQGCELWDFSLVDPDNRRPVDFARRQQVLNAFCARSEDLPGLGAELVASWPDERLKMHLIWRALGFRRQHGELFLDGDYHPLAVEGPREDQACAFARVYQGQWIVVAVPRLTLRAWRDAADGDRASRLARAMGAWGAGSVLRLPADAPAGWRNVLTAETLATDAGTAARQLALGALLARYPVAMLEGRSDG